MISQEMERKSLFNGKDRLHLYCTECDFYFFNLKKDFDPAKPLTCNNCGADDTKLGSSGKVVSIMPMQTALSVGRWHEGFFKQEGNFPGAINLNQTIHLPAWFFDYVMPHLRRFETIMIFVIKRHADRDGWARVSQRHLAHRMRQIKDGEYKKAPARQNISKAVNGLMGIHLICDRDGEKFERKLLIRDRAGGNVHKLKLQLELPPGSIIIGVEREG